jgi:hypothetical protein
MHDTAKMADNDKSQLESALKTSLGYYGEEWQPEERPQAGHSGFCKYSEKNFFNLKTMERNKLQRLTNLQGS